MRIPVGKPRSRPRSETFSSGSVRRHLERIKQMNRYLVELFIHTRRQRPRRIVLDVDATDDPTPTTAARRCPDQQLSLFDGYRKQYQYKPLLVFDGETGFPLGGYLRPGTAHDSWGAADALREIVAQLREVWPDVPILVRGDTGLALPEVYEFCEAEYLPYALGFASNEVLKRRTQHLLNLPKRGSICTKKSSSCSRSLKIIRRAPGRTRERSSPRW